MDGERTVDVSVGSELMSARERADMTLDQLSTATRIRPGLLTAMEADDFSRCGGNFYAPGHIPAIPPGGTAHPAPPPGGFEPTPVTPPGDGTPPEERDAAQKPPPHPPRPRPPGRP